MLASASALAGSSKFSRFGDIDTTAKDVYETSDHEESSSQSPDVPPRRDEEEVFGSDDDIEDERLSPRQAFEMFMGKRYDLRNADMSDSIGKASRRSRPAAEYEVLDAASRRFESPAQKLYRLKGEVAEFLDELESLQESEGQDEAARSTGRRRPGPGQLAGELRELQEQLMGVMRDARKRGALLTGDAAAPVSAQLSSQLSQRLAAQVEALRASPAAASAAPPPAATHASGSVAAVTYEVFCTTDTAAVTGEGRAAQLEARIARLEQALGAPDAATPNLRSAVEDVRRRLALLDGPRLDALQRKLQGLGPQLELLVKQKSLLGAASGPSEKKVGDLYAALERWDAVAQQLPALAARLHSLRALHEAAARFGGSVEALAGEQAATSEALRAQAALLARLERGLAENAAGVAANFSALDARLAALQAKVAPK